MDAATMYQNELAEDERYAEERHQRVLQAVAGMAQDPEWFESYLLDELVGISKPLHEAMMNADIKKFASLFVSGFYEYLYKIADARTD